MTPTEELLWLRLRDRQLVRWKFRRQHPVGRFVLDFYCAATGLAIEIDGQVHDRPDVARLDHERQELLEERGIRFLRFSTTAILDDLDAVLQVILKACDDSPSARARR